MKGGRRWILWTALAYAVILAAVCLGLISLYEGSHAHLDRAMGERLLAAANSLAATADAARIFGFTLGDSAAAGYLDSLALAFQRTAGANELAEVTLTDLEGRVLVSTAAGLTAGRLNDYWSLDQEAVDLALQGFPRATVLYPLEDTYQKSAHAPVFLLDPLLEEPLVVAIVTVSGSPDFFTALDRLRRGAWLTGAVVLVILGFMGLFLYRIQAALQRYRSDLWRQESLAAMGRMTAGIAHEIRNPLGIIRGSGQHLARILAEAGLQDPAADFIPEEVDRLDRILTGYLAFGTDRSGPPETVDLAKLVRGSVQLLEPEFQTAQVTVELGECAGGVLLLTDPRRLRQVFLNLLLNARDAMDGGGTITVTVQRQDSLGVVRIRDQGRGLECVDLQRAFEPFWTSKEKGSGLGLAISRGIVAEAGGELHLRERTDGPGAEAEVRLPLAGPDAPAPHAQKG